jgi:hypothetical protein
VGKPFSPSHRRIVLYENTGQGVTDVEALKNAASRIAEIETAIHISGTTYAKAADSAFREIKQLLKQCKTEATKPRLITFLNKAYFHLKQSEIYAPPIRNKKSVIRSTRNAKPKLPIGLREQAKTNQAVQGPTLMQIRLSEAGVGYEKQPSEALEAKIAVDHSGLKTRNERDGKGAVVWQVKPSKPKPLDFRTKAERRKIAGEKAAVNAEKRAAKSAKSTGKTKKRKKPKKSSVWTISGGGIETNRRRH